MVRKINGRRNSTESTLEKKRSWFSVRTNLCVMISGCPFCHFLTSSFSIDAFLGKNDAGLWWFTPVGSNPKVQIIWLGTATTGVISHWGAASSWKPWNFWKFFPFKFTICLWLQQPFFGLELHATKHMCISKIWVSAYQNKRFGMSIGCSYPLEHIITPLPIILWCKCKSQFFLFIFQLVSLKSHAFFQFRTNFRGTYMRDAKGRSTEQGQL